MADATIGIDISARDLTRQALDAVRTNLGAMRQDMAAVAESNVAIADTTAGAASALKGLIGLASIGGIGAAFFTAANYVRDYGAAAQKSIGALGDQARALDMTTDELQGYISAFGAAGYSQDQTAESLKKFTGVVQSASTGNKSAIDAFNQLGVKLLDSQGKLRPVNDLLAESALKLQGVTNGAQQAQLSVQLFNASGSQLAPVLQQMAGGVDYLVDRAKDLGTVATPEVIAQFEELNRSSNTLALQVRTLYGQFAAPIETAAINELNTILARISTNIGNAKKSWADLIAFMANPGGSIGIAVGQAFQPTVIEQADQKVKDLKASLADLENQKGSASSPVQIKYLDDKIAYVQGLITAAEGTATELHQSAAAAGAPKLPPINVTSGASQPSTTSSRGRAGSSRDRVGEAITQLQGQTAAAQAALAAMVKGAQDNLPLKDVQQQAELQKAIDDQIARLGKYNQSDPRIAQLKEEVAQYQQSKLALDQRIKSEQDATEVEKRFGDGSVQLQIVIDQLNKDYETGRLSLEAYNAAMKDAKEKSDDQSRALRGVQGGFDGFTAGIEQAAAEQQRANSTFNAGKQFYTDFFNELKTATSDWATTGVFDIQKFGSAMLNMIAQVGIALAQSELTKYLQGALGGGASAPSGGYDSITDLIGNIGSSGGGVISDGLDFLGDFIGGLFAEGGDPPLGQASVVGEKGPELFVPKVAGTVISNDNLPKLSGGDGGVTIHQSMTFGSDVDRSTLRSWGKQVKQETMNAILQKRRSGDGAWVDAFS